ncbi:class I SAM-dependent methyltransferase [Gordonia sp. 852002-51296_SCH5728562-b]|uniref:class I SAM-dependent methyltransferase n=2 Tax=Gordonia TaxID=2053 RepID=UPI0007EACEEE|nr:class I SAM-dependent methyltransferase [Gordonia sp. 852002-51296_SCH5728562-b]OBA31135.1 hypothetical protein A5766_13920 [Gordonia sp. 852002-51296_SCH5728562-b]
MTAGSAVSRRDERSSASELLATGLRAGDFWAVMTALGMPLMNADEDTAVVERIVGLVGGVVGKRVADLGSGCGRYAAKLLAHNPAAVLGVELSDILADYSRTRYPDSPVARDSFTNLAARGSFDVVIALSHLLFMSTSREGLTSDLRHIRGAMPDYGLLVIEQFEISTGERSWGPLDGVTISEDCRVNGTSQLCHQFTVNAQGIRVDHETISSLVLPGQVLEVIARDSGFLVSDRLTHIAADGQKSTFWVLRAQKGFNYLSDLGDFLESWLEDAHERNALSRRIVVDDRGRVRPEGTVAWGQGASLSRNHPDFIECLEPAIRPLVMEIVDGWGLVTYSSCDGHLVSMEPRPDYSEAYVGVITFSETHNLAVARLLESCIAGCGGEAVVPTVRRRELLGPHSKVAVVDIVFARSGPDIEWERYACERDRETAVLIQRLKDARS